jgi:hypothetical protein
VVAAGRPQAFLGSTWRRRARDRAAACGRFEDGVAAARYGHASGRAVAAGRSRARLGPTWRRHAEQSAATRFQACVAAARPRHAGRRTAATPASRGPHRRLPALPAEVARAPAAELSPPTVERDHDVARPAPGETTAQRTVASAPAAAAPGQPDNRNIFQRILGALSQLSAPSAGGGTAVYDIAAHTVYMPNGERLEAHSELGSNLDDPRSFSQKNRAPWRNGTNPRARCAPIEAAVRLGRSKPLNLSPRNGMVL